MTDQTKSNPGLDYTKASPREVFDHIVAFQRTQGRPAADEKGNCACLLPDGRQCAAGSLFRPAYIEKRVDTFRGVWHEVVENLVDRSPTDHRELRDYAAAKHLDLIYDLQTAHDAANTEEYLPEDVERYIEVGRRHQLSVRKAVQWRNELTKQHNQEPMCQ